MDEFFTDQDYNAPQITEYQPPQNEYSYNETQPTTTQQQCRLIIDEEASESNNFDFSGYSNVQPTSTLTNNDTA